MKSICNQPFQRISFCRIEEKNIMRFLNDFKEFIHRGNIIDLAVGVIIGGAFQKIVTSLVNDIVMPPIGLLLKGVNFKDIRVLLKKAKIDADGIENPAVTINIGLFIQVMVEFVIIAFAIFLIVNFIHRIRKKREANEPPALPTKQEQLLTEIRDLLKKQSNY
jgi:large conductance mechanosensitive channel